MLKLDSSENKVEAIRQFVHTLCLFQFQDVTGRELDMLCELLRCGGVGEKAKKSFMINYKTTKENYGQLIKRLGDKGILVNLDTRNGKKLHPDFENLMKLYLTSEMDVPMILLWTGKRYS